MTSPIGRRPSNTNTGRVRNNAPGKTETPSAPGKTETPSKPQGWGPTRRNEGTKNVDNGGGWGPKVDNGGGGSKGVDNGPGVGGNKGVDNGGGGTKGIDN